MRPVGGSDLSPCMCLRVEITESLGDPSGMCSRLCLSCGHMSMSPNCSYPDSQTSRDNAGPHQGEIISVPNV